MNRGVRTAVVLVVALVMASLASYALYLAVQRMPVREVEVNSVEVVVASQDLTVGTLLNVDHVKTIAWPASAQVPGAFATPEDVTNRGLIAPIVMNEPVTEAKLAPVEAGGGLPPSIPLGMRALSSGSTRSSASPASSYLAPESTCWRLCSRAVAGARRCPRRWSATFKC